MRTAFRALALVLLVLTASARAAEKRKDEATLLKELDSVQDSSAAYHTAYELGRLQSTKGFAKIIEQRSEQGIRAYRHGMSLQPPTPEIERLIVEHFDDPVVGGPLQSFLVGRQYQSKELFDRLYRRIRQPGLKASESGNLAALLVSTTLPIEKEVLELLASFPRDGETSQARLQLYGYLARRRNAAAVPIMKETLLRAESNEAAITCSYLAQIGTKESIEAALAYVAKQQAEGDHERSTRLLTDVVEELVRLPRDAPVEISAVRPLLPKPPPRPLADNYIRLVERHLDEGAVPDLIGFLASKELRGLTVNAILKFENAEVWRRGDAELRRLRDAGALTQPEYEQSAILFRRPLADPEKSVAEQAARRRNEEAHARLQEKQKPLIEQKQKIDKLREADPESWQREQEAYIAALEQLRIDDAEGAKASGLATTIAKEHLHLANFLRFRKRDPEAAIRRYEAARDTPSDIRFPMLYDSRIADAYQFGLRDKARAAEAYERELRSLNAREKRIEDVELAITSWWSKWLTHEIAYLKTGETFSGTITPDDINGIMAFTMFGMAGGECGELFAARADQEALMKEPGKLVARLADLPRSHFTLACALPAATLLPDEKSVLAFCEQNDPAGFWTASYFAFAVEVADRAPPAKPEKARQLVLALFPGVVGEHGARNSAFANAAASFAKSRQAGSRPADPRLATPQKTWAVFLEAFRKGDREAMSPCLTQRMKAKLDLMMEHMTEEKRREFADAIVGLEMENESARVVTLALQRRDPDGKVYSYPVRFLEAGGEWRIDQM